MLPDFLQKIPVDMSDILGQITPEWMRMVRADWERQVPSLFGSA